MIGKKICFGFVILLMSNNIPAQTIFSIQTEFWGVQKAYSYEDFDAKNPFLLGIKLQTFQKEKTKKGKNTIVRFEGQLNWRMFRYPYKFEVANFFNNDQIKTSHNLELLAGIRFYQYNNFEIIKDKLYLKPTATLVAGVSSNFRNVSLETLLTAGVCLSAGDYNSGFVLEYVFRPMTMPFLPFETIFASNHGFRISYRFSQK